LPSDVSQLLAVPAGASGMLIERVTFLGDGQPIEYTKSHYRGDAYDFVAQLNAGDLK
jgi:GntR family transcriptional regulator